VFRVFGERTDGKMHGLRYYEVRLRRSHRHPYVMARGLLVAAAGFFRYHEVRLRRSHRRPYVIARGLLVAAAGFLLMFFVFSALRGI